MENIRTQFTIPFGDGEPRNFFSKNRAPSSKPQASSNRQQAGGWAHRQQAVDIMGFSGSLKMLCKNTTLTFTSMSADMVVLRRAGGGTTGTNSRQHSSLDHLQLLKRQTITLLSLARKFAKSRSQCIIWVTAQMMASMKLVRVMTDTCCPAELGVKTKFTLPRSCCPAKLGTSPASGTPGPLGHMCGSRTGMPYMCRFLKALLITNNLSQPASSGLTNSQKKATSDRRQASSVKRQAASIPAFGHRWVGGPTGYKLFDRGPWIKFH